MTRNQFIETMARAMCEARGVRPDFITHGSVAVTAGGTPTGPFVYRRAWQDALPDATAALTAIEATGMRLVPWNPTKAMVDAAYKAHDEAETWIGLKSAYQAMLVAAQEDSTSE